MSAPHPNIRQPATLSAADFQAQAKPTKARSPTNALTQAIIALLQLHGFRAWRQGNHGVYDPGKKVFRANSSTPGISDILGYCRRSGRFCAVEVKTGSDTLSPAQVAFLAGIRDAGGFACEGRSLAQVEAALKAYLTPTRPTGH